METYKEIESMTKILVTVCMLPFLLVGCGQSQNNSNTSAAVSDGVTSVDWSSLPTSEQQAIIEVAKRFGDPDPKVVWIHQTVTDPDQKLMYLVKLSGDFKQGEVQSGDLEFSILADGSKVWAISNTDGTFKGDDVKLH
ncbi:hypothetical protein [Alicyclobacillus macrosporangiidus]|uniref:hypothetical protein n=1 Tax=Alicyclobacillus macrosporangiidus TaxID=392015 RepID=UPI0004974A6B|nr:hypothetical protein [Alicyclobacillus macrosporangiidus]MCL6598668.1 hypothetical protein [Alicyclobacillus macrosporangiidus]